MKEIKDKKLLHSYVLYVVDVSINDPDDNINVK